MLELRVDVLHFDGSKAERTPQGGLKIPAYLTRSGVFLYRNADGSVRREYRPPTEVFAQDSLATLEDAPVTDLHQGMVRADSFHALVKGHVRGVHQDANYVAGTVVVQDAGVVAAIERRDRVEISCGYECRLDATPGTTPEGEKYDAVQTAIRYNHAALLPPGMGRAGRQVALRLDGALYTLVDELHDSCQNEVSMLIRFDGTDYDLSKPAERASYDAAVAASAARLDTLTSALAAAKTAQATAEAERDAARSERDVARADAADARDPATFEARVKTRTVLEGRAREILGGEYKFDGLTDDAIREACVLKADPSVKDRLDSYQGETRAVYVIARFDAIKIDTGSVRAAMVLSTLPASTPVETSSAPAPWTAPLAMSKDK